MIARAIGLNSPTAPHVLDATAGLGGDAFVLASLGCPVTMVERVRSARLARRRPSCRRCVGQR